LLQEKLRKIFGRKRTHQHRQMERKILNHFEAFYFIPESQFRIICWETHWSLIHFHMEQKNINTINNKLKYILLLNWNLFGSWLRQSCETKHIDWMFVRKLYLD
jgi:hypothetical protein